MSEKSKTEANSIGNLSLASSSRVRGRGRGQIMGPVFVPEKTNKPVNDPVEEFGSDDETLKNIYENKSSSVRGKPIGGRPKGVLSNGRSYGRGRGGRIFKSEETKIDP